MTGETAQLIIAGVNIITSYRKENGLSQSDFGFLVGVSQTRVSQWESGTPLTPGKCPAIERVTGIPCEQLRPDIEWRRDESGCIASYCVHINGREA